MIDIFPPFFILAVMKSLSAQNLEDLYRAYTSRDLVSPDPLQFLYQYEDPLDVEVVGLVAAGLAYGRVASILKAVERVLAPLGPRPAEFIANASDHDLSKLWGDFKYRFTTGEEMTALFRGIRSVKEEFGSLGEAFASFDSGDTTVHSGLTGFTRRLRAGADHSLKSLVPDPGRGSACKRLHLYLRWMVRKDAVDLGVWDFISPGRLIVPLDTHMYHFGTCYGFTARKAQDLKTALEITSAFKNFSPEDPVRYDFSLTRFGIRHDLCWDDLEKFTLTEG